jgi:hypothetical protein
VLPEPAVEVVAVAGDWELWVGEESRLYDTREEAEQVNRVLEAVGWGGHVTDNRRTLGRLSRATALVVVLDGSRTIGPKCAAAIVGAEDSGVPYIVLVPMLFLIELAGVPPEEIATGRKIPKALGTTFALDIEGGRMEIPSFRFTSALDMAIQFTLGAIAGLGDAMKGSAEGAEGAEGAGGAEGAS